MLQPCPSFFEGLTDEERARLANQLVRRRFAAGSRALVSGDRPLEISIIQDGTADILLPDQHGAEQVINWIGPGDTFGEMSFFTGHAASATVRAATTLDVLTLSQADFAAVASAFPRIYHNLGAILSYRLLQSNRRALREPLGRLVLLADHEAPPLLGYALACSVAWHTRSPTLLVLLRDANSPETGSSVDRAVLPSLTLEAAMAYRRPRDSADAHARLLTVSATGPFAAANLVRTLDELVSRFHHVLVQVDGRRPLPSFPSPRVRLVGPTPAPVAPQGEFRPYTLCGWVPGSRASRPNLEGLLRIPPLEPADEEALRKGTLSASAARALGWAARDLTGLKVGLAFGAGTEKGYAHIGALRVLRRVGLLADYLAGTSIGSVVASLYALGHDPDASADLLDTVGRSALRFTLPIRSLLSSAGLRMHFRRIGGSRRIEDLEIPLAVVAADLLTGREVVFRRGLLWQAALASCSVPGIYPPQRIGKHLLVDGGAIDPVPVNVVAGMGADKVIAIKLADVPPAAPLELESLPAAGRPFGLFNTILRARDVMYNRIEAFTADTATIVIEPNFQNRSAVGLGNFKQGRQYIALGEEAAELALPRLAAAFPWLRG